MDPELKKALEALRSEVGAKNVDALARIEAIEKAAQTGTESTKALRAELDVVKQTVAEREQVLRELRENARVIAMRRDPIQERHEALEMLGMIVRSELARAQNIEMPAAYRREVELVRAYREQVIARSTITPMSTTGSYLVPTVTDGQIQSAIEDVSELLGLVDFQPGLPPGGTFNFTFLSTRPSMQEKRSSSDTAMTASDPVFAQMAVSPAEMYVFFPVDNKMFQMSAASLGGFFEGLCRDAIIDKLAYWALRADGTSTYNSITGLLNETNAAYIASLTAGHTSMGKLDATDLFKVKGKCLKRGRGPKGRWLMDLEVQGIIEGIDRTGKTPLVTYGQDGSARLLQNPLVNDEYMPDTTEDGASKPCLLYGDLATLMVGMVGGIQVASDSSVRFDKNQTCFRGTVIADIKRKPVASLILGKTAAQ